MIIPFLKFDRWTRNAITLCLCLMTLLVPLVFTPLTRSVFEVNKLMVMRVFTMITLCLWLFKSISFQNNERSPHSFFSILGLKWQKTGLEIPILGLILSAIVSTVFSQNPSLSLYGSYDRWEGLVTTFFYISVFIIYFKLTFSKRRVLFILGSIYVATALSGIYGVFQSLGFDVINWSIDPTLRVFACINNPVHYCAYVAMITPMGLGFLLYLSRAQNKPSFLSLPRRELLLKFILFISTVIIFYNVVLSYSRASLIGLLSALIFFYFFATHSINTTTFRNFIQDTAIISVSIGLSFLIFLFNLHKINFLLSGILWGALLLSMGGLMVLTPHWKSSLRSLKSAGRFGVFLISLYSVGLHPNMSSIVIPIWIVLGISALLIYICITTPKLDKLLFSRFLIIAIFLQIQFVSQSLHTFIATLVFTCLFYVLTLTHNPFIIWEKKVWLLAFILQFWIVISAPVLLNYWVSFAQKDSANFNILNNTNVKISSYKSIAIQGSARTSMWKSAMPWIQDHWLIGSGLDTIKYMYPVYRRSDYGRLEGGHNFTPDKLHNEYINTFATKGLLGMIAFYGLFLGSCLWIILKRLYAIKHASFQNLYLIISTGGGVLVYLGQVLFNFGVVATLYLFYVLLALSVALCTTHFEPSFDTPTEDPS